MPSMFLSSDPSGCPRDFRFSFVVRVFCRCFGACRRPILLPISDPSPVPSLGSSVNPSFVPSLDPSFVPPRGPLFRPSFDPSLVPSICPPEFRFSFFVHVLCSCFEICRHPFLVPTADPSLALRMFLLVVLLPVPPVSVPIFRRRSDFLFHIPCCVLRSVPLSSLLCVL